MGLERERARWAKQRARQGRKQGVSEECEAHRTETTMFSTGPFKSHSRNQIYTRNRWISGVFLCILVEKWGMVLKVHDSRLCSYHSFAANI